MYSCYNCGESVDHGHEKIISICTKLICRILQILISETERGPQE